MPKPDRRNLLHVNSFVEQIVKALVRTKKAQYAYNRPLILMSVLKIE